jgi:hypothetical protein
MSTNLLEYPVGRWISPRLACVVTLSLVFLCGGVTGALVMDLGIHRRVHAPAFGTVAGKAVSFDRIQKELDLTPAQSTQVQSVLNDFWQYYRTVLSEGKTRVELLLTEPQRAKFERMLQDYQPQ